jgi:Na+-transporting methylmalonyl-CoA/oxaloacetate decarboxylase gamma subunit
MPAEPGAQQRALAALLVALLSLTGVLALGDPQRGVLLVGYALLAGVVAMWLAVTAQVRARRGRTARPHGSAAATVIAGVGILLSVVLLLAFVMLGRQMSAYGRCLSEAGTSAAQQACRVQFTRAVNKEIATLRAAERG